MDTAIKSTTPAKWEALLGLLKTHDIGPGEGQLLVFTEFADTARWLRAMFDDAGFSTLAK